MSRLTLLTKNKSVPVVPYSGIASRYDDLMCHVNYRSWAGYIDRLIKRFGKGGRRVVDGCCGTGKMIHELCQKGYQVCGFDLSLEMIHQANRNGGFSLFQGNIKNVSLIRGWDAFLCLYDSIQYLSMQEIAHVFKEAGRCLLPQGLFIFDMVTEYHILKYWADFTELLHFKEKEILRQSWYDRRKKVQHTVFEITETENRTVLQEHHRQYVFSIDDMEESIHRSEFVLVGLFQDYTFKSGQPTSDRIHFVCRKEYD